MFFFSAAGFPTPAPILIHRTGPGKPIAGGHHGGHSNSVAATSYPTTQATGDQRANACCHSQADACYHSTTLNYAFAEAHCDHDHRTTADPGPNPQLYLYYQLHQTGHLVDSIE